jgi:carotenoid cleavage dioxygenase
MQRRIQGQIQRRHLLQALAALGVSPLSPAALLSAQAKPAAAADFAAALRSQPLLTPMKGVDDSSGDCDTAQLATRGRWPEALRGRFYRNGPALFERNGERYHHWFDGDGMVQQFTLAGGRISHRGRLVQTSKLRAERTAGRFLLPAFGTSIDDAASITGADSVNVANTNALEYAGRVLAMWEGGSAYALDPADMSTRGPVVWGADLAGLPFSAHPKLDSAGNLWNFGTQGRHLLAWHVGPDGRLVRAQLGVSPYVGGMVHDMAVTERYLVVPLPPVKLDFASAAPEGPRHFALDPGQPLRILVMEKADISRQRVFELPAQLVFHVGNAHEEADGSVVLSFVGAPDAGFLDTTAVALMNGQPVPRRQQLAQVAQLQVARLHIASGRVTSQAIPGDVEFPRIDPRRIGVSGAGRAHWLLSGAAWKPYPSRQQPLLHGVQLTDLRSGSMRRFDYGEHAIVEEHILVPKPGRAGELDAWLLGTTFDAKRQQTVLNLLDAAHIEAGPIAQATLPYVLPLGFHGNFTAA